MNVKIIIERGEDGYFVGHWPSLKKVAGLKAGRGKKPWRTSAKPFVSILNLPPEELAGQSDVVELAI